MKKGDCFVYTENDFIIIAKVNDVCDDFVYITDIKVSLKEKDISRSSNVKLSLEFVEQFKPIQKEVFNKTDYMLSNIINYIKTEI